ncbi:MAG: hypothetical protein ACNS63_09795 [Candidatus Nitrospinota bacterium M3_3B_026]
MLKRAVLIAAALAIAAAPGAESENGPKRRGHGATRLAPDLIDVMHDMAFHFSRIEFGIFTNNRDMIRHAAEDIGRSEMPADGVAPYIRKNAEDIAPLIPESLKLIRETSEEIADAAGIATMLELQQKANIMAEVCVGCHDLYRD